MTGMHGFSLGTTISITALVWAVATGCSTVGLQRDDATAGGVHLVRNGEPLAVIVLPAEPGEAEQQAADELIEHIALMSGATLPVVAAGEAPGDLLPIRIGAAADDALAAKVRAKQRELRGWNIPEDRDTYAFALWVSEDGIQLRGGYGAGGTRTAAYELLEQLGVRWFMPGDLGLVTPQQRTLSLHEQQTIQVPSFKVRMQRNQNRTEAWVNRVREGTALGRGRPGGHSTGGSPDRSEQPEYWAMRPDGRRGGGQLCLTGSHDHPENPADPAQNYVLRSVSDHFLDRLRNMDEEQLSERIVFNVGPRDGAGFCLCEMCKALDPGVTTPFTRPGPTPSYTDRYVWFFNQVSKTLEKEFPEADILFGFYAYGGLMHPPQGTESMGNLAISVAPIHVCRIHGPNNPICPESDYYGYMLETWGPYVEEIWCRGYSWNLAEPQFPFPMIHRIREELPLNYELGMTGYGTDANHSWGAHLPMNYVWARLMWDHTTDVDALMEDFYRNFYGPARDSMRAYHQFMEANIRDADYHTGSVWDIPKIYPGTVRAEARGYLERAAARARRHDDPMYAERIRIQQRMMDYLDAYCESRDRRDAFDFAGEKEAMERTRDIRDRLVDDFEYPMILPRHARSLFTRFVERPTMQNVTSTGEGKGEIVARFNHEWKFHTDPEVWGRYIGLHKAESEGGNWQRIRTDSTWSNQGLRYYFGQVWYRQTVDVPAGYENQTINIWFSGVDRTAEVWINGEWVGANHDGAEFDLTSHGSAFRPFQFDASDAIRHDAPNVVVVRSYRTHPNELGTGGLMGPVMFYVPPAPAE